MNLRRLQQLVFRMQHDAVFAARVLRGDPATMTVLGLNEREHASLCAPGAAAFGADRDHKRGLQFLRNTSSEFRASLAWGPRGDGDRTWATEFPESPEFHRCIEGAGRLPLAFADFAARIGQDRGDAGFCALVEFESAMARARRAQAVRPNAQRNEVVLAPSAQLCFLPAGTHRLASRVQNPPADRAPGRDQTRDAGVDEERSETVLLLSEASDPRPGGLRELRVEALTPLVALFLVRAEVPQPEAGWREFAAEHELAVEEVETVVADFLAEGVLLRGGEEAAGS